MSREKSTCVKRITFQLSCENGKHTRSIIEDSVIMCDKIIDATKTVL